MSLNHHVKQPIGIFDSGVGGLTIVREVRKKLPNEDLIYYGDMARLPYGTKSQRQIVRFSTQNAKFLSGKKVKAIVVACNSSASAALSSLRRGFKSTPFVDVIQPVAEHALRLTKNRRIGVVATQATVESEAYPKALKKVGQSIQVFQKACPLFVSYVEEGLTQGKLIKEVVQYYLTPLKKKKIDTLILGCTHYPLIKKGVQDFMGKKVRVIDSTTPTARALQECLKNKKIDRSSSKKGKLKLFVSDKPRNFQQIAEKFLGEKLSKIELIRDRT